MLSLFMTLAVFIGAAGVFFFFFYGKDLPDYSQLADYNPPIVSRLYAGDGRLLEEYAKEKRFFVPISDMPKRLIDAFLAAEDRGFYEHGGVDFWSIFRATIQNIGNILQHKPLVGGSTITQQVAKNFLLTNERSMERKVKEAILAFRINLAYSKDKILELYLNEIYLGQGSYGVAAAAANYFDKSIDELSIEEAALLAAMPKAPSGYDPEKNPERALQRRNWVIHGMQEAGFITEDEAKMAALKPIALRSRSRAEAVKADFFAEEVRRELVREYGSKVLYEGGLTVRTTLDPAMQEMAAAALRRGLIEYDMRHGWRGPITKLMMGADWQKKLAALPPPPNLLNWQMAVVLTSSKDSAGIGFTDGSKGVIKLEAVKWAKAWQKDQTVGAAVTKVNSVIVPGDVIAVQKIDGKDEYALRQIPAINGAIVVANPHSGKILAMVGGYGESQFNRATQAKRQPGSAFKPFVYLAAMENGFTPSTIVEDAPIELDQGPGLPKWSPQNYHDNYYGPTTLRVALEHSRNIVTVRLSVMLGIQKVIEIAKRFGISANPQPVLSTVLGAVETDLTDLTNAYAMLANGGRRVYPALIERIQDRTGKTIYKRDKRTCPDCNIASILQLAVNTPPVLQDTREQVTDPRSAYQVVSMLEGVVERGTGTKAKEIGKIVAGKTGTTNDSFDTWFIGFSPDLVCGVFAGFDTPATLGTKETGASVAVPIFTDFMKQALKDRPSVPFRVPQGIKLVRVDHVTGMSAGADTPATRVIWEAFKNEQEPRGSAAEEVPSNLEATPQDSEAPAGTGGIY